MEVFFEKTIIMKLWLKDNDDIMGANATEAVEMIPTDSHSKWQ